MWFDPSNRGLSTDERRIRALAELAYTAVDLLAGLTFLVGSVLFLHDDLHVPATWCFIAGSALFTVKPLIRLVREVRLSRDGRDDELADRVDDALL